MNIRLPTMAVLAFTSMLSLPSSAQTIRPGLWETTVDLRSANGKESFTADAQKMLASLTPEERKIVEDAMAKQGTQLNSSGVSAKMCLTKEMARRYALPVMQDGNCRYQRSAPVGDKIHFTFTCTNPPSSGEGEVAMVADTAYRMTIKATSKGGGQRNTMQGESSGKWLSPDCGHIKPVAMSKER